MKTNVANNSLFAYWSMRDAGELPEKERAVYFAISQHGKMTREQIAERTGMKEGSACGRVNKLIERGMLVEVGDIINPMTNKLNAVVDIAPHRKAPTVQEPLFPELVPA